MFTWSRIPREDDGIANVFAIARSAAPEAIAPDWVIEILSPDQSQTKVTKNILHCLKHHTQIGWLIDPKERSVFVYRSDQPTDVFDKPEICLPAPEFAKDFSLTLKELFDWQLQ